MQSWVTDISQQMSQSHGSYTACVKGGTAVSHLFEFQELGGDSDVNSEQTN